MARTRTQLRQLVTNEGGLFFYNGTTASSGNTATTLTDVGTEGFLTGRLDGLWAYISGGTPSARELFVTDSQQSTGVLTFQPAIGAADHNSVAYELSPWSATAIHQAIKDVLNQDYVEGLLTRQIIMKGLVTGSPLYNNNFDSWTSSSVIDGWPATGGVTVSKEIWTGNTARAWQSAKLTGATGYIALGEPWKRWIWDFKGRSITLYCWALTSTASNARLNLYNGSNQYSSYHTGGGTWELLSVTVNSLTTDADLEPRLLVDTTNTAYFSEPWVEGGPMVSEYPIPLTLLPDGPDKIEVVVGDDRVHQREIGKERSWPDWVFEKHVNAAPDTTSIGLIRFPYVRPRGHLKMTLIGDGPLSLPSVDTDVVEINEPESYLIAKQAAVVLLSKDLPRIPKSLSAIYQIRINRLIADIMLLKQNVTSSQHVASLSLRW